MTIIVKLESGVWLRKGDGDPCRTLVEDNATTYPSAKVAVAALISARKYRPFPAAELQIAKVTGGE